MKNSNNWTNHIAEHQYKRTLTTKEKEQIIPTQS